MQIQLDLIKGEFERGIFLAVYRSLEQCLRRALALDLLFIRHFLRGVLIVFPIYLITIALALAPAETGYHWLLPVLLPGVLGWTWVLIRGAWSDYRQRMRHHHSATELCTQYLGRRRSPLTSIDSISGAGILMTRPLALRH